MPADHAVRYYYFNNQGLAIQAQPENPLAKQIMEGRFAAKDTINKVGCVGGG